MNCTPIKTALAALTLTFSVSAADYVPQIIAGVVKADSWDSTGAKEGFYKLEAIPGGQLTRISQERDVYAAPLGGAVYEDGKMKGIHFRTIDDPFMPGGISYLVYRVEYDMKTFEQTKRQTLSDMYMNLVSGSGMTHDPVTGKNYGIFYNFDMSYNVLDRKLCTIDFSQNTPQKTQIMAFANGTTTYAAMAAAENGLLYVVSHDGYLYTMNKNTGSTTLLGYLGVDDISRNPGSMTFDTRTKKLYWCYVSNSFKSYLYEINYAIGEISATRIMQVPDNAYLVNMYIPVAEAADAAPAAVTDLAVSFAGESYTGEVSFALPSVSYDGDPLNGSLNWTIYANDKKVSEGTGNAGSTVNASITVPVPAGETTIKVIASNPAGEGAPAETSLYVGIDTPQSVSNVTLSFDENNHTANLSWTAPTTGLHGLTLTPSDLKYDVVRYPGMVKVASAISTTTFSESLDDTKSLTSYYYEVTPVNGGVMAGEPTASNKIVVGQPVSLPFVEHFSTDESFDIFTAVDANNDGKTWSRYHYVFTYDDSTANYARMEADNENQDDDWLLLPPMNLKKGAVYEIAFNAKKQFSGNRYNQLFEVKAGKGLNVDGYAPVMGPTNVIDVNFADFAQEFTVEEDGTYHVGIHAMSPAESGALDIDYVQVKLLSSSDAPKAVTDLVIVAELTGLLTATATFTTPTQTLHGDALSSISKIDITDKNGKVVGTIASPEPGKQISVNMSGLTNGMNTYTVTPYYGTLSGQRATATVFVGEDTPTAPRNVKLVDDGTNAIVTWDAPEGGANSQYINPDKLKYNLYSIDDFYGYITLLNAGISSPFNTGVKTDEGDQTLLYYALDAETAAGFGEPVATNSLVIGAPYTLPYVQSFADAKWGEYFVWIEGEKADWNIGLTRDLCSDNDGGAVAFEPNMSEFGVFNLGKISLNGAANPILRFDYYVYPLASSSVSVAIDRFPQGVSETVANFYYYNLSEEGWHTAEIRLADYVNDPFIIVKFAMAASSQNAPIVIDNIRIEDISGIHGIGSDANTAPYTVYSIDGRIIMHNADTLNGLEPGIYIINGHKQVIK